MHVMRVKHKPKFLDSKVSSNFSEVKFEDMRIVKIVWSLLLKEKENEREKHKGRTL